MRQLYSPTASDMRYARDMHFVRDMSFGRDMRYARLKKVFGSSKPALWQEPFIGAFFVRNLIGRVVAF